jgi:glutaconate CoA-transferase subunit B
VEKLPFITCPGHNVTKVVSNMGVYEKPSGSADLHLSGCFPGRAGLDERTQQVMDSCGWKLKLADNVEEVEPPTATELQLLRSLLPATMA